jgi:hypothetical protein
MKADQGKRYAENNFFKHKLRNENIRFIFKFNKKNINITEYILN